jgi:hypothetical protein
MRAEAVVRSRPSRRPQHLYRIDDATVLQQHADRVDSGRPFALSEHSLEHSFAMARNAPRRATVDLQRLQETLFGDARDAPIGEQIEILALRLDQGQPHLHPAFDARHLDGSPKACETQRYLRGSPTQHHYVRFPTQLKQVIDGSGEFDAVVAVPSREPSCCRDSVSTETSARRTSRLWFLESWIGIFRN